MSYTLFNDDLCITRCSLDSAARCIQQSNKIGFNCTITTVRQVPRSAKTLRPSTWTFRSNGIICLTSAVTTACLVFLMGLIDFVFGIDSWYVCLGLDFFC